MALKMVVDCGEDCLIAQDGTGLMCHSLKMKNEKETTASKGLHVLITQRREVKGTRVVQKGNRLLIPVGVPLVL